MSDESKPARFEWLDDELLGRSEVGAIEDLQRGLNDLRERRSAVLLLEPRGSWPKPRLRTRLRWRVDDRVRSWRYRLAGWIEP